MRTSSLPGASVTIRVSGQDLREYDNNDDADDDRPITTAFVEAAPGASFSVELILGKAFPYKQDNLNYLVYLDGTWVRGEVLNLKKESSDRPFSVAGLLGEGPQGSTLKRFVFAEHETTDGIPKPSMKDKFAQLGEITVKLTRCRNVSSIPWTGKQTFESAAQAGIPEKALKGRAVTCHSKLGAAEAIAKQNWVKVEYPWGQTPLATYTFRYRTHRNTHQASVWIGSSSPLTELLGDLQIEGIIERTPTPVPLEDRDTETLTADEARELVRRFRTREQGAAKIKPEVKKEKRSRPEHEISSTVVSDGESDGEGVTVVSDDGARKRARVVETIDLTED